MKLSADTFSILKNFSLLNQNICIKPGNILETVSVGTNIFAQAKVQENFPVEVRISDLNHFLRSVALLKDADFDFQEQYVMITSGKAQLRFIYASPKVLLDFTKIREDIKKINHKIFEFELSKSDYHMLVEAASIMSLPELVISGDGSTCRCQVLDIETPNSCNTFTLTLPETTDTEFNYAFEIENLILLAGNYKVQLLERDEDLAIAKFIHTSGLNYSITDYRKDD